MAGDSETGLGGKQLQQTRLLPLASNHRNPTNRQETNRRWFRNNLDDTLYRPVGSGPADVSARALEIEFGDAVEEAEEALGFPQAGEAEGILKAGHSIEGPGL